MKANQRTITIMEKLNIQTADAAEENIQRIAGLFPGCVTETKDPTTMTNFDEFFKTNSPDTQRRVL